MIKNEKDKGSEEGKGKGGRREGRWQVACGK